MIYIWLNEFPAYFGKCHTNSSSDIFFLLIDFLDCCDPFWEIGHVKKIQLYTDSSSILGLRQYDSGIYTNSLHTISIMFWKLLYLMIIFSLNTTPLDQ